MTALRGMTWSHPRGYDPLVACARLWRARTGVEITWEQRSLQDFESYPVEDLARRYDLIVIDHPHVGQIVREACLLPLNRPDRVPDLIRLANQSVGQSWSTRIAGTATSGRCRSMPRPRCRRGGRTGWRGRSRRGTTC